MEKTISLRDTEITFSIWDLGGQKEFLSMLPLVCNDAVAIFFMFDLTRKATLLSVKEWYRQARLLNRVRNCSFPLENIPLNTVLFFFFFSFVPKDRSSLSRWNQI
jgi:GTPase SAR1 family protein